MSKTEAQKKANIKYDKAHFKTLGYKCKLSDIPKLEKYANEQGIKSMSELLGRCVMYAINNNIQLLNNLDSK